MSLSINSSGVNHARQLIKTKKIESAKTWNLSGKERKALKPSMFLAKDDDTGELKFPFGKENKVYRSGLIAAKRRAAQYGHSNVIEVVDERMFLVHSNEFKDLMINPDIDTLNSKYHEQLIIFIRQLLKLENYKIEIIGHTDNKGSDKYNHKLGKRRAENIKNYLIYLICI